MSNTQEKMNEYEKMFIIEIMNDYMVELITEGYPQSMIDYTQALKVKLKKILDEQQD